MTTHIILPTTGPQPMLRDMLASLAPHTQPCHLVTVLNTREDWRRAAIRPLLECLMDNGWQSTLVEIGQEVGYVRACNLGWSVCRTEPADTLVVLNDDLQFQGPWLEKMEEALAGRPRQVGPSVKTVGPDGTWGGPSDRPYVEGWCFATKAGYITAQDLFDPQFEPQFCEDMDFSLRMGDELDLAQVDIPVEHIRSATVGTGASREPYWTENRRKLCEKWGLGKQRPVFQGQRCEPIQSPAAAQTVTAPYSPNITQKPSQPQLPGQAQPNNWIVVP